MSKYRRIAALTAVFPVLIFAVLSGTVFGQKPEKRDAATVWEKVIAAKGGRDELFAISNLVVKTAGRNRNDEKKFQNLFMQDLYLLPDRWWSWFDQRPGFPLGVAHYDFDKEIGYSVTEFSADVVTFRPKKPRTPGVAVSSLELDGSALNNNYKERFLEDQMIYLMETKWFHPKLLSARTEGKGAKKVEVVEASFGRKRFEYFLDPKTNLPSRIKIVTWFVETKDSNEDNFYLSDYVEISGVKFAQVISRGKGDDKRVTYQVNVAYDENLFDRLPNIKAGPDAWKPK